MLLYVARSSAGTIPILQQQQHQHSLLNHITSSTAAAKALCVRNSLSAVAAVLIDTTLPLLHYIRTQPVLYPLIPEQLASLLKATMASSFGLILLLVQHVASNWRRLIFSIDASLFPSLLVVADNNKAPALTRQQPFRLQYSCIPFLA